MSDLRTHPAGTTLVSTPSPFASTQAEPAEGEVPPGLQEIAEARRAWKKGPVARAEWKLPPRRGRFTTWTGISVPDLVTPYEARTDYLEDLGFPGEPPFTRGVHPTMYRGRLWSMRTAAGTGSAASTNQRFQQLLALGQRGLEAAFDGPTLRGQDSDTAAPEAIGASGVAIDTLDDMETLFDGIPLDDVAVALPIDGPATVLLAFYVALCDRRGIDRKRLAGTLGNDCLSALVVHRGWVAAPRPALRLTLDALEFCARELPRWNSVSISGSYLRAAGASVVQEVAFALASGLAYVRSGLERGLAVDDFAPRLSFSFDIHGDFFEEIAKLRAARRLWSNLVKDRFEPKKLDSLKLRVHCRTAAAAHTGTPQDDVARMALQALAAVLGGTQSLHAEASASYGEESMRVALHTQQILAEETGVASTIDPLGGSYLVEDLTRRIETDARILLGRIDELGGMLAAVEGGHPQRQIHEAAERFQRQMEAGERRKIGAREHAEAPTAAAPGGPRALAEEQLGRLAAVKGARDGITVTQRLGDVRQAAAQGANVVPPMIEAAKAHATLQELCDVLREELGTYPGLPSP